MIGWKTLKSLFKKQMLRGVVNININDVNRPEDIPDNIWPAIFKKQKELLNKYQAIEGMPNEIVNGRTYNIDTPQGQKWIKDFAWRVTEEICEALEAKRLGTSSITSEIDDEHFIHYLEELTDALHFMTEMTLICGIKEDILFEPLIPENEFEIVYYLGLMCNCLKNKPWKQTQMLTDRPKFETYLIAAFRRLWGAFKMNNITDADIYSLYFKKNIVNNFRIRSKY